MTQERRNTLLALAGFAAIIAIAAGAGFWSYHSLQKDSIVRRKGARDVEVRVLDASYQIWANDEVRQWIVAEVNCKVMQVSKDGKVIKAEEVDPIVFYKDGEPYLTGRAALADYDQTHAGAKRLSLYGGVALDQVGGEFVVLTEEIEYRGDQDLVLCPRPTSIQFGDSTLKTATLTIDVPRDRVECPSQVVLTTKEGATLVSGRAEGDLKEEVLTLQSNVIANITVGEVERIAERRAAKQGEEARKKERGEAETSIDEMTRLRIRTHRMDYDMKSEFARCPSHVIIRTADGVASADSARIEEDAVFLLGGVRARLDIDSRSGTVDIATEQVDYLVPEDEFVAPKDVKITTRDGVFTCGSARVFPAEGRILLRGGVSGRVSVR